MNWKLTLYAAYVSSGQAKERSASAEEQFRPRKFYFRRIIHQLFPTDRKSRILDIGCGHGALLYFLGQAGFQNIAGVDSSSEQVAFALRLGVPNVEAGDAFEFLRRQETDSVDVVSVVDVLEHLERQELFDLLIEIRRVLAPGGRCVGHVPNGAGLFGMRIRYGDLTHEIAYSAASLQQAFRSLGFARVQCLEDKPIPHGLSSTVRLLLWQVGTFPFRILLAAETGTFDFILTQNLFFAAYLN